MNTDKQKTIFFLGAGFSCASGAPSQNQLLKKVLEYNGSDYGNPVNEYKDELKQFLGDAFSLEETKMKYFNLEDFYTPIDKCISQNLSFRGYSLNHIKKIKNILSTLVSIIIDDELTRTRLDTAYLEKFVRLILNHKNAAPSTDHVSIITTNWDILLDRRFYSELRKPENRGALDYGTMVVSAKKDRDSQLIPPLVALTRGMYTIKLLKIHGSLNWLKCPSCNRLFVNPEVKVGIMEYNLDMKCRFCEKIYILATDAYGLNLEPQIISPTYLKDFSNYHFNQIWNFVSTEISEASKIVFIGYSFPQADYEIRQLLARKVPDNCEISVVLDKDKPEIFERYGIFFGRRQFRKYIKGVSHFVENNMSAYL